MRMSLVQISCMYRNKILNFEVNSKLWSWPNYFERTIVELNLNTVFGYVTRLGKYFERISSTTILGISYGGLKSIISIVGECLFETQPPDFLL